VSKVFPGIDDISENEDVQLLLSASTGSINGEENWPCNGASHQADDDGHLEKAQKEEGIQTLVLKDVRVRDGEELGEPIEQACMQRWGVVPDATRVSIAAVQTGIG
jgi:hypothetical protein